MSGPINPIEVFDGSEAIRVLTGGRWRWMMLSKLFGLRLETVSAKVVGSAGVVTLAFAAPFKKPPVLLPMNVAVGRQLYLGVATSVTETGAVVTLVRSKGTLLLSDGPFEYAPAGTTVSAVVIGS